MIETVKIAVHCHNLVCLKLSNITVIFKRDIIHALCTRHCVTSVSVNKMPTEFDANHIFALIIFGRNTENVTANRIPNLTFFGQRFAE